MKPDARHRYTTATPIPHVKRFREKLFRQKIVGEAMLPLSLFVSVLAWSAAANGQLFGNIIAGDSLIAPQCSQVEIQFGGGVEPYSFYVYSYYTQAFAYGAWTDSPGTVIEPGNTACLETPPFQRQDEVPVLVIPTPTPPAQLPAISSTPVTQSNPTIVISTTKSTTITTPEKDTTTTRTTTSFGGQGGTTTTTPFGGGGVAASPALDDCISTASCRFNPTRTGPSYPQQTQLGAAFDNCDSSIPVHNTFSGSVTVTDNWSVDAGVSFDLPKFLGLDVHTSVEHGKEVTMSQTSTLNDVVYFQSTSGNAVVAMQTIGCNQSWPIWNATAAVDRASPASRTRASLGCLLAAGVVIMALLL
ncbi:hypothetical protein C8J57DRAFT_1236779 [Mycena rebaudengoi]|nr:hypothetical protein C8J57DRAFT_1236779 [Mycena rebaudengoi]